MSDYSSSRRVRTPEEWLTATLLRMVLEHCARPNGGQLDSFGWPVNAEAMRMLADAGFLSIEHEAGDEVRATVVLPEVEAFLAWMAKADRGSVA